MKAKVGKSITQEILLREAKRLQSIKEQFAYQLRRKREKRSRIYRRLIEVKAIICIYLLIKNTMITKNKLMKQVLSY